MKRVQFHVVRVHRNLLNEQPQDFTLLLELKVLPRNGQVTPHGIVSAGCKIPI